MSHPQLVAVPAPEPKIVDRRILLLDAVNTLQMFIEASEEDGYAPGQLAADLLLVQMRWVQCVKQLQLSAMPSPDLVLVKGGKA